MKTEDEIEEDDRQDEDPMEALRDAEARDLERQEENFGGQPY